MVAQNQCSADFAPSFRKRKILCFVFPSALSSKEVGASTKERCSGEEKQIPQKWAKYGASETWLNQLCLGLGSFFGGTLNVLRARTIASPPKIEQVIGKSWLHAIIEQKYSLVRKCTWLVINQSLVTTQFNGWKFFVPNLISAKLRRHQKLICAQLASLRKLNKNRQISSKCHSKYDFIHSPDLCS